MLKKYRLEAGDISHDDAPMKVTGGWIYSPTDGVHSKSTKRAKIRNRYNQAPHLTRVTNGKVKASHN